MYRRVYNIVLRFVLFGLQRIRRMKEEETGRKYILYQL